MKAIIEWLFGLAWWQNMLVSLTLLLLGLIWTVFLCAIIFRRTDRLGELGVTEDDLKRNRENMVIQPRRPKLKGLQ